MATYSDRLERQRLCRRARAFIKQDQPIPLTLFAQMDTLGIDINELERTIRNG